MLTSWPSETRSAVANVCNACTPILAGLRSGTRYYKIERENVSSYKCDHVYDIRIITIFISRVTCMIHCVTFCIFFTISFDIQSCRYMESTVVTVIGPFIRKCGTLGSHFAFVVTTLETSSRNVRFSVLNVFILTMSIVYLQMRDFV